jgi:tetratricopeptide (TPR) repeat protein
MPARISVCLIARDEAAQLERCLRSVQGAVDEIILLDTGSKDATPQIGQSLGAQLHFMAWPDDFSAARNACLQYATGDWVLILDADEELSPAAGASLQALADSGRADAYRFVVRNLQPPGELAGYIDLRITRFFRRHPDYRYEGIIHEQITPSVQRAGGAIADADALILHYGYQSKTAQAGSSRAERNLTLLKRALLDAPKDAYLLYQAGITLKSLSRPAEALDFLTRALASPLDLSPDILEQTHMKLAQLHLGRDDEALALSHARTCLQLNPINCTALYIAGLALFSAGQLREAYACFETLTRLPEVNPSELDDLKQVMAYIRANS